MFTIGADPEIFVAREGKLISAHGLIKGTKYMPHRIGNGAIQVDGMALEFNIAPAVSEESFLSNVKEMLSILTKAVKGYTLTLQSVADFGMEYINSQPPEAKDLGCEPDMNAWVGQYNPRPDVNTPFRTASGHIHIGWEGGSNDEIAFKVARQMDFYLGLPSILADNETRRRELYGKAGACRVKPYGVEYRVLSNFWLGKDSTIRNVYKNAVQGLNALASGKDLAEEYGDIQAVINTSNRSKAAEIMSQFNIGGL